MKSIIKTIFWLAVGFLTISLILLPVKTCNSIANDTANVIVDEFSPSVLLKKYEEFKDMSAILDKKLADIKVYENRFTSLKEEYGDVARSQWAKEDREQYNLWMSELAGISASYNDVAAKYNANMVKFNYRFTNVGDLPQGATEVLPREYKPYLTK